MSSPLFSQTALIGFARPTTGNTASDGSGTLDTLLSATTLIRVDQILVRNSQTTAALSTALLVRVFLTDTAGSNPRLLDEVAVAAATRSTSAVGSAASITFPGGLLIASGQIIKVCQSVFNAASQLDIIAKAYTVA